MLTSFNDTQMAWHKLGDFKHILYSIMDIDSQRCIVDVLFKFQARQQIVAHRHLVHNTMLVLNGEHRIYRPNGELKEIRPAGRFTASRPDVEPHREGGGAEDAIVYFSVRGDSGPFYEILDDELQPVSLLGMNEFLELYRAQQDGENRVTSWA